MKSIYTNLLCFALLFISLSSMNAQKDVVIQINHFLNETPFSFSQESTTNLEHPFDVSRMEYYLSEISIIHDGGQEMLMEDLWVLVNAFEETLIPVNGIDVESIEGVSFHVGVDEAHNHLDPASWPTDHALYPKFPSMHWGWSAGYRFVAMEGNTGPNVSSLYQFHGLGDKNYFKVSIENPAIEENGVDIIYVAADYAKALHDMNMSTGVISHGETGEAKQVLLNFRDYVFSAGSAPSSTLANAIETNFRIFPNPVSNNKLYIDGLEQLKGNYQLNILDITGSSRLTVQNQHDNSIDVSSIPASGFYILQLIVEEKTIFSGKFFKL